MKISLLPNDRYLITGGYIDIDDLVKANIENLMSILSRVRRGSLLGSLPRIRIGIAGEDRVNRRYREHCSDPIRSNGLFTEMYLLYRTSSYRNATKVEERLIFWSKEKGYDISNPDRYNAGNKITESIIYVYICVGKPVNYRSNIGQLMAIFREDKNYVAIKDLIPDPLLKEIRAHAKSGATFGYFLQIQSSRGIRFSVNQEKSIKNLYQHFSVYYRN
jgi:hypothetical protein